MAARADLFVLRDLVIPADELREVTSRSGGPGGQNVNKVATRVSLRWRPAASRVLTEPGRRRLLRHLEARLTRDGWIVIHAASHRSQLANRLAARLRLAALVRGALSEPKARVATKPTRASEARRQSEKARRARKKRQRARPSEDD